MRAIAAIPAAALLAGAAFGLSRPEPHDFLADLVAYVLISTSVAGAMFGWAWRHRSLLVTSVTLGFFTGGWLLSSVEWQRAWRPPLRVAFEEVARAEREAAAAQGRRMPEDDEAFVIVEGVLRADASRTDTGVSLGVAVDWLDGGEGGEAPAAMRGPRARQPRWGGVPSGLPRGISDSSRGGGTPAASEKRLGGILVTVVGSLAGDRIGDWRAGRRVRMPVMLRRPSRYLDPGVPDHERALARRGTTLVGTVKSGALVEVLARGSWLDETMASVRAFSRHAISGAVGRWSPQSAAIVTAIVIGDRAGLDDDVQRRLQEAGTYHVIAISGGNIAILAGLLLGAFRRAGLLGRTAMLSAIAALVAYALLVGGGASVDRATLMAVVYFGARAFDQRSPPLNALAVVAALIVAADPLAIADPAFLLTFGATLAIALVSTTLAAGAGWLAHAGAAGLVWSAELVRFASVLTYRVAPPTAVVVIIYYCALAVWWITWRGTMESGAGPAEAWPYHLVWVRPRLSGAVGAIAIASALWILTDPRTVLASRGDGRLHVTFLDVGQGDSIFVRFPHGSTLLVDAGGLAFSSAFGICDRVVAPVIRDAGFRRLDVVALTHGDPDHIGGVASIIDEFRPREVWEGIPVPRSEPLTALRRLTQSIGSRWANVYARDRTVIDDVLVVARHPEVGDWERQKVRNDDSIVLELRWRDVSVLLTGDIGRPVERTLAATIPPARLRVMKVPHHGSLTSSTADFVHAMHPNVAVVSAGRGNHFGHPVPEVLERYRAVGAEIFRTDRDGAVTVDTDGTSIDVHTFTGRRLLLF